MVTSRSDRATPEPTVSSVKLRPPLPPPLSHDGIQFVRPLPRAPDHLTPQEVAAIALALHDALAPADHPTPATVSHQWRVTAAMESVARSEDR
jgi:hypothetical protein